MVPQSSGSQVRNGKAFEWAIANAFSTKIGVEVSEGQAAQNAETDFNSIPLTLRSRQVKASHLAIEHIFTRENIRDYPSLTSELSIANDSVGRAGDVRDVILKGPHKILGVSCKNNHRAFKHSRLSGTIDFVSQWNLSSEGASSNYWETVTPIFSQLHDLRNATNGAARWSELPNKINQFYSPILSAFETEIRFQLAKGPEAQTHISKSLIDYIVGNRDFYKIIANRSEVEVLGFNFHGELGVSRSRYPSGIHSIERHQTRKGTTIIRFLEGHTFAFRIHNASTKIEPSLKFDIQALSLPSEQIYSNHISLNSL
jgi:hypothetical protein